jgi:hypothetical protein
MSNDKNNNDLPGYPHYPKKDDITYGGNNNGNEDLNEDELYTDDDTQELRPKTESSLENKTTFVNKEPAPTNDNRTTDDDGETRIVMGTEADVSEEELNLLENADQGRNSREDEQMIEGKLDDLDEDGDPLNETDVPGDLAGDDLDVPGEDLDDDDEKIGEEDEENNYYSLGGDNHEGQEENNGDI